MKPLYKLSGWKNKTTNQKLQTMLKRCESLQTTLEKTNRDLRHLNIALHVYTSDVKEGN